MKLKDAEQLAKRRARLHGESYYVYLEDAELQDYGIASEFNDNAYYGQTPVIGFDPNGDVL